MTQTVQSGTPPPKPNYPLQTIILPAIPLKIYGKSPNSSSSPLPTTIPFGKHKGSPISSLPLPYIQFLLKSLPPTTPLAQALTNTLKSRATLTNSHIHIPSPPSPSSSPPPRHITTPPSYHPHHCLLEPLRSYILSQPDGLF